MFITKENEASCSSPSQSLLKPIFWSEIPCLDPVGGVLSPMAYQLVILSESVVINDFR